MNLPDPADNPYTQAEYETLLHDHRLQEYFDLTNALRAEIAEKEAELARLKGEA